MRSFTGNTRSHALWAALCLCVSTPAFAQDAGFGNKIPLGMAVKQIVPPNYTVQMGSGVDPEAKVSWSGGGWKGALASAAKGAGYGVTISGDTVKVVRTGAKVETESSGEPEASASRAPETRRRAERVEREEPRRPSRWKEVRRESRPDRAPSPRVRVASAEPSESVSGGGFVMIPVRGAEPKDAPAVRKGAWREASAGAPVAAGPALVVREGDNLHAVLKEWTAVNGWRLVWNNEFSYKLNSSARFSGDFVTATSELLKSMKGVRPLITASFFNGNKTLVVGNDSSDGAGQ